MCVREGCDREPTIAAGPTTGMCEQCVAEPGCEWRGCRQQATVRLWYGGLNLRTGKPVPGADYCDPHADEVRLLFRVTREEPAATRAA